MAGARKQFDPDSVVTLAMSVFQENGYEQSSINELLDVMQIQRSSFYSTFGSKRSLFLRALTEYSAKVLRRIRLEVLESSDDYIQNILDWLTFLTSSMTTGRAVEMGARSFLEVAQSDPEVNEIAESFFLELEKILYTALQRSNKKVVLKGINLQQLASLIASQVEASLLLHKAGVPINIIQNSILVIRALLDHGLEPK
tara:strand:+ start:27392 stop:27988 length:597 start_codon:yes stop_codon:yes gene_type:complete